MSSASSRPRPVQSVGTFAGMQLSAAVSTIEITP